MNKKKSNSRESKQLGFSLIELMVVLAISAILIMVAAPNFLEIIKNNRMTSKTNELVTGITIARQAAVTRGVFAFVCRTSNADQATPTCNNTGNWANGLLVYTKPANTTLVDTLAGKSYNDTNDELIAQFDLGDADTYTVTHTRADRLIGFSPNGLEHETDTLQISLCDDRTGDFGRRIDLSVAGRVSTSVITCPTS